MPATISTDFITLLFNLFTGAVMQSPPPSGTGSGTGTPPSSGTGTTGPTTVYMGLGSPGSEVGTTDGNGTLSGYNRIAIPTSSLTVSVGTLTIPRQTWTFKATPSPNSANSWFVSDSASGGKTLFSGPLGSGPGGNLTAASSPGSITVATSDAANIAPGDVLKLGSTCSNNLEYVRVSTIGADNGGNTVVSCGSSKSHPSGEAWSRDSRTRAFSQGYVETVSAAVSIVSQP